MSLVFKRSEEEEVSRARMDNFTEEGCPTGWQWVSSKATDGMGGALIYWDNYILPLWPKLTQRHVAAADLGTPRYDRERQMLMQSHLWPPASCRCKTVLICSRGCCLESSHGSEALLRVNVKQRRFSRVVVKQSQKFISDFQSSCTGHL